MADVRIDVAPEQIPEVCSVVDVNVPVLMVNLPGA